MQTVMNTITAAVADKLGESVYARVHREGAAMRIADALRYALAHTDIHETDLVGAS